MSERRLTAPLSDASVSDEPSKRSLATYPAPESEMTAHANGNDQSPSTKINMTASLPQNYEPDLPATDWAGVRDFVLEIAGEVIPKLTYPTASILNALAHHVDWCVNVAGMPVEREFLFRRDVIGAAVAVMPSTQTSTRGRRRSLLFRVGELLGAIPVPSPLPALAAASPTAPYDRGEVEELARWTTMQPDPDGLSARALIALGLGAGLPTRDIAAVRVADIASDGGELRVEGSAPRFVPVADDWKDELRDLRHARSDEDMPLFRPGISWTKNIVTNFVNRSFTGAVRPTTQRMRSTWLVHHLSSGTPMQDLLAAAGLTSMDALVRYEQFLPPPNRADHARMLR